MSIIFELIVIALMLAFNAVFAAYEMALASISRARLTILVTQKRKGAEDAIYMKDRMEASLAVIQVGITLVGAIAAAVGGSGATEILAPVLESRLGIPETLADILSLIFIILPLSALTITFAELIPKTYALNHNVWVCLKLSPGMRILYHVMYPAITVLERIVKSVMTLAAKKASPQIRADDQLGLHELTAAVSLARTSRLIGAREEKIVLSAAQLSVRPVREIMLPIADVSVIPLACTLSEALVRAHMDMHTRFPVSGQEKDPQTIQGYINFKDIIAALKINPNDPSIRGIIRPIKTVLADTPISSVLEKMMQEKLHITMVGSHSGRILGMITLEDIIEELVGEIEDEYDRLPAYIHPLSGGWIVGGGVPMTTLAITIGMKWTSAQDGEALMRFADWFERQTKKRVAGGETVEINGFQFTVRKFRRKKLSEAVINPVRPPAQEEGENG
ncbi:MAG: hemolysin family protein [Candidatus Omnitrophota bacterium]|nr:hemolysin family protein [Candidatus Omnitrophota bacterium]MDZ4242597.1 hemolysin family protein [Candidatus Omnitrophota bacterium]